MIRYHGGPIWPQSAALAGWTSAHAMISFARPEQIELAAEVAHSFTVDNGAFSFWKAGHGCVDSVAYLKFIEKWAKHPGFDWCLIPDVVDGSEAENDLLVDAWPLPRHLSVPVWHMHESTDRLRDLVLNWPRVAIGSSGEFSEPGARRWWSRISEAMAVACDSGGYPLTKLHGLRQMDATIFSHVPYASVDSTAVARGIAIDNKWTGSYLPPSKDIRAMVLRARIETHASANRWAGSCGVQSNLELLG